MRRTALLKSTVWVIFTAFFFTGVSPAFSGSRIMPTGSVKVFKEQKLVQVLKEESALPDGALLTTEGKCGVRSDDFYLVADDGCTFSIMDQFRQKKLRVDNGVMYYAVTQKTGQLTFITPAGVISVLQILFNADVNGGILKGYVDVDKSQVQLGVLEGGSIVVMTANGEKKILSGKQIVLSMADPIKKSDEAKPVGKKKEVVSDKGKPSASANTKKPSGQKGLLNDIPATYLAGGAAVLAGATIIGIVNANDDSSTASPASPSSP